MDTTGKRLRQARKAAGLNQIEAAAIAGISNSHLSKIEADKDKASLETVLKLAIAYRCDLNDIVQDDEDLAGREVASDPDEVAWLRAFRRMTPEQKAGAMALLNIRRG